MSAQVCVALPEHVIALGALPYFGATFDPIFDPTHCNIVPRLPTCAA